MRTSKQKVVDSALELFHKKGYQNTSVDDIIKKSKITKSNLYYHFSSKEELGLIVLEIRRQEHEKNFLSILKDDTTLPNERLKKYFQEIFKIQKSQKFRYGLPLGNLANEMCDVNEKFRNRLSIYISQTEKAIELCIKEGIKAGVYKKDISPKELARMILSLIEGGILVTKTSRSGLTFRSSTKALLKLLERKQ
ncbi:MAG: TetR/AcrR family transcriptional regulator [Thermodesulfobacteriota bacterium]